jgi:hypothetical protein
LDDESEASFDEESDGESEASGEEESGEETKAASRDDQVGARLLGMKHTLNNLYELSYLIHIYKSEENALPKPERLGMNDKGEETEQFRPERQQQQSRSTQHSTPLSAMVQPATAEQGRPVRVINPGDVVDQTERSLRSVSAQLGSPHQDLDEEEWESQAGVPQGVPLSSESAHGDHDKGVAQPLHPSIARNMLRGASPERSLSGPQSQQVPQSESHSLAQSLGLGQPRSRRVPPADISPLSGRPTAAERDRGQYQGLGQLPQRPQSVQTRSHTNIAPDALRVAANQVRREVLSPDGPDTTWSIDPKIEVPMIGRNAHLASANQFFDQRTGVRTIIQNTPPTPRNSQAEGIAVQRELIGTAGSAERLFPDYIVRPSRFFCLGRVFLVLWAEPAGGNGSNAGTIVTMQERGTVLNHLGERVFSKVRRFVVIRESDQYCNVLPITTYSGQGVAKRRVVKSEHAIIYTGSIPPQPRPSERPSRGDTGMRPQSIRVDPDNQTNRLDPMSRVDFGGVHQVWHNIKTKSLGVVNRHSIEALMSQFADVWQDQFRTRPRLTEGRSAGGVGADIVTGRISNAPHHGSGDEDEEDENEGYDDEEGSSEQSDDEDG